MDTTTTPPAGVDTSAAAPVKPGYKTTEFWLSTVATAVGLLVASGIVPATGTFSQVIGLICGVLGALGYTVSRGMVKQAQ